MAQMTKGAEIIKGTFTAPATDDTTTYALSFGKTFNTYLFLIEMTDESKTALVASGVSEYKGYSFVGIYPKRMTSLKVSNSNILVSRFNPSTLAGSNAAAVLPNSIDDSSITFNVYPISTSGQTYSLYSGYTYNYYIVEIK